MENGKMAKQEIAEKIIGIVLHEADVSGSCVDDLTAAEMVARAADFLRVNLSESETSELALQSVSRYTQADGARKLPVIKAAKMSVTQVWFSTPVDYLNLEDVVREQIVDTLLSVEGVGEVEHYSEICIRCDVTSASDVELFAELAAIRSRVETVFRSYHVWPGDEASAS